MVNKVSNKKKTGRGSMTTRPQKMLVAERKKKVLELLANEAMGNITAACRMLGVSRTAFYKWVRSDPEFSNRVKEAIEIGNEKLVDVAESALLRGVREGNPTLIIFTLVNRSKGKWQHVQKIVHEGKVDSDVRVVQYNDYNEMRREVVKKYADIIGGLGRKVTKVKKRA